MPQERSVLDLLRAVLWYADPGTGQAWASLGTLAGRAKMDIRTARTALDRLNKQQRWLRAELMTWAELTAICRAQGRYLPTRDDLGTAPYLITLLDGEGKPALELGAAVPKKQGKPQAEQQSANHGSPERRRDRSPKDEGEAQPWMEGWSALNEAHASKSASKSGGVRPLPAKLSRQDREAMGECLSATAGTLAARIHAATGATLERRVALEQLAARVMDKYWANPGKNDHLKDTKHRLEDLRSELFQHASNSMNELVREHVHAHRDAAEVQRRSAALVPTFAIYAPAAEREAGEASVKTSGDELALEAHEQEPEQLDQVHVEPAAEREASVDELALEAPVQSEREEIDAALWEFLAIRENTPEPQKSQTPEPQKSRKQTLNDRRREELAKLERWVAEEEAERARRPALPPPSTAPEPAAEREASVDELALAAHVQEPEPEQLDQVDVEPAAEAAYRPIGPPGVARWGYTPIRPPHVRHVHLGRLPEAAEGEPDSDEPAPTPTRTHRRRRRRAEPDPEPDGGDPAPS